MGVFPQIFADSRRYGERLNHEWTLIDTNREGM